MTKQERDKLDEAIPLYLKGALNFDLEQRIQYLEKNDSEFANQIAIERELLALMKSQSKTLLPSNTDENFKKLINKIEHEKNRKVKIAFNIVTIIPMATAALLLIALFLPLSSDFITHTTNSNLEFETLSSQGKSYEKKDFIRIIFKEDITLKQQHKIENQFSLVLLAEEKSTKSFVYHVKDIDRYNLILASLKEHNDIYFATDTAQ